MKRTYADSNCIRNGTIKGLENTFDQVRMDTHTNNREAALRTRH